VQSGLQAIPPIPLADSPDGGGVLLDFFTQPDDALRFIGAAPQDLRAAGDP
jgi:hypothetical protein